MKFDRRTSLLWLALTLLGCDASNETRPSTTPGDTATTAVPDWVKNATEHPAGFHYAVLKEGEGTSPTLGSIVTFHCTCTANGKEVVDTRRNDREETITLSHLNLIPGMVEALRTMKKGERWQILLPSKLAYGESGYPGVVPKGSPLEIDLELVRFQPKGDA